MSETYQLLAQRYERLPGRRIVGIDETTQEQVIDMVNEGLRRGYSALQIANGVEAENYPGVASIFDDPYRSETISRTEGMFAFNWGAGNSFLDSGVTGGEAMDGSDDPECAARDGQLFTLDPETGLFVDESGQPIEDHPNGTLAWAPVVDPTADLLPTGALAAAGAGEEADAESQARARQRLADDAGVDPDDPTGVLNYLSDADFTTGVLDEIEGANQDYGVGLADQSIEARRGIDYWDVKGDADQPRDESGRWMQGTNHEIDPISVLGAWRPGMEERERQFCMKCGRHLVATGKGRGYAHDPNSHPGHLAEFERNAAKDGPAGELKYSPDQQRDERGRFGSGMGGEGADTPEEKAALATYQGSGYGTINAYLRGEVTKEAFPGAQPEFWNELNSQVDAISSAMTPLPTDQTVYRSIGVNGAERLLAAGEANDPALQPMGIVSGNSVGNMQDSDIDARIQALTGATIEDKAFISTTTDKEVAEAKTAMARIMFRINIPAGTMAVDLNAHPELGDPKFAYEHEVLLDRDQKFRVDGTSTVTSSFGAPVHVVSLSVVR